MSKVFTALAMSVDGYITGPAPSPGAALGTGGAVLFDWYGGGDTRSEQFSDFRLSKASAKVFDAAAARVGAVICGRNTYDHSRGFGGGSPHPHAPLFVLSHRPAPDSAQHQTFVTTGIVDAVALAADAASDRDVALMGSEMVRAALEADLLDALIVHQVPVLLGNGIPLFPPSRASVRLKRVGVVAAPEGVTHMHYEVKKGHG
jgi:dihydrofolate reductase